MGTYHEHARPDVAALVPMDARRILDIGCGAGALGAALKQRQECAVVGIEQDADACGRARSVLDGALCADAEGLWDHPVDGRFDCIIMADVLEHLRDPWAMLDRVRERLAPGGCLIVSVPNLRNRQVVAALLAGEFAPAAAGIMDRTHLHWFTRRKLQRMLWRRGYFVEALKATIEPGLQDIPAGCAVRHGRLQVACDTPQDAAEFYHYQYLARAVPAHHEPLGSVSVIIPVWNQLSYTRACLASLHDNLPPDSEIIIIDNGSTDGTHEWLRSLGATVRVITWPANLGFIKAANAGLREATGDTVILLNNDTIVPEGAIDALVRTVRQDGVGMAGPLSNNVSGPQQIPVSYTDLTELPAFAWDVMRLWEPELTYGDCPRLVGFCLAARRECVAQIGLLDERFGMGFCDDDDWCRRALEAGWRVVISGNSFVHHAGSVSFAALGMERANEMLEHNLRLLQEKYDGRE